ncbi:MAG: TIGR03905 family TSCPD domain-containing protein [Oscillospiraceae bacterium]
MTYNYTPRGVCSRKITVELSDSGVIENVSFTGGCNGNTQGVAALVKGMKAEEAISRMKGINCNGRGTSCPDQLAVALTEALEEL